MKMPRWKGKLVTEKQCNRRLKQVESGKSRKKKVEDEAECAVDGRRIVDFKVMLKHMRCSFCTQDLSLQNIQSEVRYGLASVFNILCHHCLLTNKVPSGAQHLGNKCKRLYDVNTKSALGTLHAGLGYTSVNKYLQILNIPNMTPSSYKRYEREIGPMIEAVAKESCEEATELERSLTIQNLSSLEKLLPQDLQNGFLHSRKESQVSISPTRDSESEASRYAEREASRVTEREASVELPENSNISVESALTTDLTRLFVAYDMGWSKRGSGRQYDSLNGYAAIIGTQSGRILDFATRNRQCRLCNSGHTRESHDCRLNFYGSAKAMEPDVAAQLVANSEVLQSKNVEVGVFIGDDDSSSILAVRNACNHTVVKHSDKNHTSRSVTNMLYKIDKKVDTNKELTSEAVKYLHRCFTYAVSQNTGNSENLAHAIRNIPFHAFNIHDNCGDWCSYSKDPENYTHSTVLGGLQNENLFRELKILFDRLADNADKFSTGASSQANESLNSVMAKKAPKAVCYSLSESADFRFACAVAQKNRGEKYVQDTCTNYRLSPGTQLSKHVERCQKSARIQSMRAKTIAFKSRRRDLRKQRSQLRNRSSILEGETYKSHMGLLSMPAVETSPDTSSAGLLSLSNDFENDRDHKALVFFDLETAGLQLNCQVLQIAMKCGSGVFNEYINPNGNISATASKVNGLTNEGRDLYLRGQRIQSKPMQIVAKELLEFLTSIAKPCVLIAHNCAFDAPRLMRLISITGLVAEFVKVIDGFVDTLPLFRKKFPGEDCSLIKLTAKNFALRQDKAHDAMYDVLMLQNVTHYNFTVDELLVGNKSFIATLEHKQNFESLKPLANCVSKTILTRMADAGINYVSLQRAYCQGQQEIISILQKRSNGKSQVIKTKKILDTIISHFKE